MTRGTTAPYERYFRTGMRYYVADRGTTARMAGARTRPVVLKQGAVEPLARYYRAPLRYYRKAGIVKPEEVRT